MRSTGGAGVRVCVARAHVGFRLLVRSALTQQRHDGSVAESCGIVQRREAKLRAQQQQQQQHNARRSACVRIVKALAGLFRPVI
jgi:hypothetical protein